MKRLLPLLLLLSCHRHAPLTQTQLTVVDRNVGIVYDSVVVVRFKTPLVYGMLRLQVESCTGKTREGWPKFYIAPVSTFGPGYSAAYFPEQDAIVFGLGNEVVAHIVRHELIHFVLAPGIKTGHPPEYFSDDPAVGRCAGLLTPSGS